MQKISQALMGDRRPICEYHGEDHVPYPMVAPPTAADIAPFVDKDILVTFTVKVPLQEVAHAANGTLAEYIEENWLCRHAMMSPEYRAIGATFDDFGQQYAGLVHLQVTCQLTTPSAS